MTKFGLPRRGPLYAIVVLVTLVLADNGWAEPVVDGALSEVRIRQSGKCSIVRIIFNFRVRYKNHFPLGSGAKLRIQVSALDRVNAHRQIPIKREAVRVSANNSAGIRAIDFEVDKAQGPLLLVYFDKSANFRVGQGADFTSIIIVVSDNRSRKSCDTEFAHMTGSPVPKSVAGKATKRSPRRSTAAGAKAGRSPAKIMAAGRKAMTAKKLNRAIQLFTKVLAGPESKYSPQALELLGLARQRKGQIAHAKAEYKNYLARYPDGPGAARVRQRLAAIMTASVSPKTKLRKSKWQKAEGGADEDIEENNWSVFGSFSQFYFRDEFFRKVRDPSLPPDLNRDLDDHDVFQNEFLTSFDVIARYETPGSKSEFRFSGNHQKGFQENDDGNDFNVAKLQYQLELKDWDTEVRVGRQTRNTGGVLGRFDGGLLSWQATPTVGLNAVVGSPVRSYRDDPFEDDTLFYGLSVDFGPYDKSWDTTLFFIEQRAEDILDRQAVGLEARYFDAYKSAFLTVDYDIHFDELNAAIFSGSYTFDDKSTLNAAADYRKSPYLLTSNALIGQPLDNLRTLLGIASEDELVRYAIDRTATSKSVTIGYSKPIDEQLQITGDVTWSNISGTGASGGVEASPGTGDEFFYSLQFIGSDIVKEGDIFVAGLRYADRSNADYYVLDLNTRYPWDKDLRLNPRLRFTYKDDKFDDNTEFAVLPSMRFNYHWTRNLNLELEVGGRFSFENQGSASTDEQEYYVIAGYRYDFHADNRQ